MNKYVLIVVDNAATRFGPWIDGMWEWLLRMIPKKTCDNLADEFIDSST